jgi:hypothetical protein
VYRRRLLTGIGSAISIAAAGCLGVLTGEEAAKFSASPIGVAATTLDDTGYEGPEITDVVIEREFEVMGQTREVHVTNYLAEYEKAIDMGPLGEQRCAMFSALPTPKAEALVRQFTPVADTSNRELAEMIQDNYEGIDDLTHESDDTITILDQETTHSRFTAKAEFDGTNVDIYLHVSEAVEADDDLAITVGGYPQLLQRERDNIVRLMESVDPDAQTE